MNSLEALKVWNNLDEYRVKLESPLDCHKCFKEAGIPVMFMLVCPICGNKRCPHASDHNLTCTGSNEPNQPGSIY